MELPFIAELNAARLSATVRGKVCLVTGASDGIGARLAERLGAAGARVLLVARTPEKLKAVGDTIRGAGGQAFEYVANLAQEEDCDRVVQEVLAAHGHVEVFVSNAGRSIRRSAKFQGGDRFHDFQRLMALNFEGGLRLALGLLPSMIERRAGHIVHVSSFGVPTRQPRFAGYAASKSAFDAALQSIAGEVAHYGIHTSSVFMPLVQTKMVVSKGHSYDHVTMLTVDQACEYVEHAVVHKQREVIDGPSRFLALLYFFRPSLIVALNSLVYRMESEQAPNEAATKAALASPAKRKRGAPKQSRLMQLLTTLMWFFSRLELVLAIRIGVPWIVRDIIVTVIFLLVIVLQPPIALLLAVVGGIRSAARRLRGPKDGGEGARAAAASSSSPSPSPSPPPARAPVRANSGLSEPDLCAGPAAPGDGAAAAAVESASASAAPPASAAPAVAGLKTTAGVERPYEVEESSSPPPSSQTSSPRSLCAAGSDRGASAVRGAQGAACRRR